MSEISVHVIFLIYQKSVVHSVGLENGLMGQRYK